MPLGFDVGASHSCVDARRETDLDGLGKSARLAQVLSDQLGCRIRCSLELAAQNVRDAGVQPLPITAKQRLVYGFTNHGVLESRSIVQIRIGFGKNALAGEHFKCLG